MRLSVLPSIIMMVAALAFMFAFMASGVAFLPTFFNLIGGAACVWLLVTAGTALARTHSERRSSHTARTAPSKAVSRTERRA